MVWKTSRVITSKIDRASLGGECSSRRQPHRSHDARHRPAARPGSRRGLTRRDRRPAGAEEDQAGDPGRGRDEHRDLAHGVPGADVDQGDVDDVAAAAEGHRLLGVRRRDRGRGAGAGGDQHDAGDGRRDQQRRAPSASSDAELQRPVGEVLRKPAEHQHEHHQGDGLDQHLGQGQVGRAVEEEQHGGAVAGDADQDDRLEPTAGPGGEHRGDRDDRRDHRLPAVVPDRPAPSGRRPRRARPSPGAGRRPPGSRRGRSPPSRAG